MIKSQLIFAFISGILSGYAVFWLYILKNKKPKRNPEIIWDGPIGLIGETPIVYLPKFSADIGATVLLKMESMNPGGSAKDRVGLSIINDAEERRKLKEGGTVYEGTVGSTGIALAWISAAKNYKCHLCVPDDQSPEKYQILEAFGAEVEKVRPASIIDPMQFVNRAAALAESDSNGFFADQFENLANFNAHLRNTGVEIYEQTKGNFDFLVMGCGTGGTLAGCTLYLKKMMKQLKVIIADPQGSGLFNKVRHDTFFCSTESEGKRSRHQVDTVVEGIGINRMTANISKLFPDDDSSLVDDAVSVSDLEAVQMSRYIASKEGLLIGSSTAVNLCAVKRIASKYPGTKILTIACDNGQRHLSKFWNDEFLSRFLNKK